MRGLAPVNTLIFAIVVMILLLTLGLIVYGKAFKGVKGLEKEIEEVSP